MSIIERSAKAVLSSAEEKIVEEAVRDSVRKELEQLRAMVAMLSPQQRARVDRLVEVIGKIANDGAEGSIAFAIVQCKITDKG